MCDKGIDGEDGPPGPSQFHLTGDEVDCYIFQFDLKKHTIDIAVYWLPVEGHNVTLYRAEMRAEIYVTGSNRELHCLVQKTGLSSSSQQAAQDRDSYWHLIWEAKNSNKAARMQVLRLLAKSVKANRRRLLRKQRCKP